MKEKMEIKEKKHHEKGILHLCCQVISSGQMFESEQTIPMPSPSPARIVLDNLLNQLSVSTDSTLENVSFFWYRTQICLCSSLKHEGLLNHLYFPQRFGTCGWCGCLSCCSSQKHIWLLFVIICCQKLFLFCMKQSDYITLSRRKTQHFFRWATVQNKTFTTTSFCSDPIPMTTTYFIIQLALWLCKTKKILSSDWLLKPAFATLGLHTLLAQKQEIQQNHTHPFQDLITVVFIGKKEWYLPTCIAVHRVDLKEEQIHMNKMNYYAKENCSYLSNESTASFVTNVILAWKTHMSHVL